MFNGTLMKFCEIFFKTYLEASIASVKAFILMKETCDKHKKA